MSGTKSFPVAPRAMPSLNWRRRPVRCLRSSPALITAVELHAGASVAFGFRAGDFGADSLVYFTAEHQLEATGGVGSEPWRRRRG